MVEIDRVLDEEQGMAFLYQERWAEGWGYKDVAEGLREKGFIEIEGGIFTRPGHPEALKQSSEPCPEVT